MLHPLQLVLLGTAFIFGFAVSRFRLPPLVGYLLAGLTLAGLGYSSGTFIEQIGQAGVLLLLFSIGLGIRFKNLGQVEVLGTGFIHIVLNAVIFIPFGWLLGLDIISSILVGFLLAFSSIVMAAKALDNRGELEAYHGRIAVGIMILHIIIGMVVVSVSGGDTPSWWMLSLLLLPLLRPVLIKGLEWCEVHELQLVYGLLLAVGGGYLFVQLGLSAELGALVLGTLLANHEYSEELSEKLWGLKEAFLLGFFLNIGLTGFPTLSEGGAMLLLLLFLPVKQLLFLGLLLYFKLRNRTAFLTSSAVTSYSGITLIAGAAAVQMGWLPQSMLVVLALATAGSFAFNAFINAWAEKLYGRLEPWLQRFERDVHHPDAKLETIGKAHFLVLGMGRAGSSAYEWLCRNKQRVVGLDINPERIEYHLKKGHRVVYADAQDPDLWSSIDLSGVLAVMITIPNVQTKINVVKLLRNNGYSGEINALTLYDYEAEALKEVGANAICLPVKQAGERLAEISARDNNNQRGTAVPLRVKL